MPRKKTLQEVVEFPFKDKSEWAAELESLNDTRKRVPWHMARLLLWGFEFFCDEDKDCFADLYDEMSEQLEVSRKTLQNYVSVARRFPAEDVHERLEMGHHVVVVAMPTEIAHSWLSAAEANGWSVNRLRAEIKAASQAPSEDEEDDDSGLELVLRTLGRYQINATGDEKGISMGFADGRFVNITSNSKLNWSVT